MLPWSVSSDHADRDELLNAGGLEKLERRYVWVLLLAWIHLAAAVFAVQIIGSVGTDAQHQEDVRVRRVQGSAVVVLAWEARVDPSTTFRACVPTSTSGGRGAPRRARCSQEYSEGLEGDAQAAQDTIDRLISICTTMQSGSGRCCY